MGYRSRLGKVNKCERYKYLNKSFDDVVNMMEADKAPYRPAFHEQLFELGKYFDQPEHLEQFYTFDIYEEAESEFSILSKEGLAIIIAMYHDNIAMMYEEAGESTEKACDHIKGKIRTWSKHSYSKFGMLPYYLDQPLNECDGFLVNSWKYEYALFNLVYIYRSFDWENDYLIYSAW